MQIEPVRVYYSSAMYTLSLKIMLHHSFSADGDGHIILWGTQCLVSVWLIYYQIGFMRRFFFWSNILCSILRGVV